MNKQFRKIGPPPEDPEDTEADERGEAASQRPLRGLAAHRAAMGRPKPSQAARHTAPSATRQAARLRQARGRGRYSVQARRMASGSPHQPSGVSRSSSSIAPSTDHIAVTCRNSPSMLSSSKSSSSSSRRPRSRRHRRRRSSPARRQLGAADHRDRDRTRRPRPAARRHARRPDDLVGVEVPDVPGQVGGRGGRSRAAGDQRRHDRQPVEVVEGADRGDRRGQLVRLAVGAAARRGRRRTRGPRPRPTPWRGRTPCPPRTAGRPAARPPTWPASARVPRRRPAARPRCAR